MKFGKEFAVQMVPEWQQAYMDYSHLKKVLKEILRQRNSSPPPAVAAVTPKGSALKRRVSLYRAFSGLTNGYSSLNLTGSSSPGEDEVILASAVQKDGPYQTMFLMPSEEGGEHELAFFRRLDQELNKTIDFYKSKVAEMMKEAEDLSKQMDALIAFRIKVDDPSFRAQVTINLLPTNQRKPAWSQMDVIQELEMRSEGNLEDKVGKAADETEFRPATLEILDHVKINVESETPVSTLKSLLKSSNPELNFNREELRKVEGQMRHVFVEFYQKLRLLKSYCFLNLLAFSKIMKKYDKITSRNASKAYLDMVDNSYLGSSDEVNKLIERVEATFIKHFSNGNRRKGMKILRPQAKRERHRLTYFLGFLSGCSTALLVAIIILIHARDILKSEGRGQYMENIFPLYSFFGFIVLHMVTFSGNIFFWRRFRVNYAFIFGFKQGTEIGYRELFLLSSGLAVLTLAAVLSNLDMEMDPRTKSFKALTELVPLGLLLVLLLITFCPLNIVYRPNRFFLIRCAWHCLCAPLYKVTLPDFFLADQLTSQVQAFRSLEFYVCYYGWGEFKRRSNGCQESRVFEIFYVIVAIIPYWFRVLQCLRRLFEEKDRMHGLNGLKYFSTIVAVFMRTAHDLKWGRPWTIMAALSSGVATIASSYWDIVIDWGLLRRNSRNPWLRDKLLISKNSVYFVAIILNLVLRLAWMQSVLGFREAPFIHRKALTAIVACLEIIRRGIWNFFRLENEHLNNVGKYRAFKSVPLPFNYDTEHKVA